MSKLRWGMVGGGPNSIGRTHRLAAGLDGHYDLVAGVFSRDTAKNGAMGKELGIAADRRVAALCRRGASRLFSAVVADRDARNELHAARDDPDRDRRQVDRSDFAHAQ